ncbi:S-adenosyl-L-methionine-dependent methyltransferase [Hypoxylon fuscum]|nr:S-adenosyl-L-methionine-dependent methyltransferase [Hypoxylon fuscum]
MGTDCTLTTIHHVSVFKHLVVVPSSPEPPLSYPCQQPIPSVEEGTADELNNHPSSIVEDGCGLASPVPNPWLQAARNETESGTRLSEQADNPYDGQEIAPDIQVKEAPTERPIAVEIPQSTLLQPRSLFESFVPPATEAREHDAIAALVEVANLQSHSQEAHMEFELDDFSIYFNSGIYPYELRPLHHLAIRQAAERFYFDGVLSCGERRFYLKKILFRHLPIGNYGSEEHTVGDQIWVRSQLNEDRGNEIYYKLGSPAIEYRRFHEPFLWIADLSKHVLDYCENLKKQGRRALLHDFKSQFSICLLRKHLKSTVFERWHSANCGSDFRGALVANIDFIWKEAHGLDPKITSWHGVWEEIKFLDRYKPNLAFEKSFEGYAVVGSNPLKTRKDGQVPPTIVTPYVHDLFSHMVFGKVLEPVTPSAVVEKARLAFIQSSRPVEQSSPPAIKRDGNCRGIFIASIEVGDVISTRPDDDDTDTEWIPLKSKHYDGEHLWFGLVQRVHELPKGGRSFDVIWLYQSVDTPCGVMKYPWNNELFLSNNCTCHHDTAKVRAVQVLSTHSVEWFGRPDTTAEFFVRQTYLSDECRWTTLKKEHLTCAAPRSDEQSDYKVGDAVLVETNPKVLQLETFIVEGFFDEGKKRYVRLRKLSRRREVDKSAPNSPPNEVVYTDELVEISSRRVFRHCLVRAFQLEEKITTPYDCNGTGDAFFMTHQEVKIGEGEMTYVPLDTALFNQLRHGFRQGFDPSRLHQSQKLQGLDLFCGGGNFGRGLEDGGGIEMRWANDIWREAIQTYMANCEPNTCTPFLGSVDDLLLRATQGHSSKIPRPGDVHFISAGSPCPGFSLLTADKTTNDQRKNQSLVASFASYVDLYRPYYGILENVPQMVNTKRLRDACVFSQLVCSLVGLGYQVQVMFLDAWSYGAPQSRSRVFLCFSAPGFRMPKVPEPSHSHPPGTRLTKLGEMSCGRPFDSRKLVSTPFKFVSIREAVADLPELQDAMPDYCVGFPDHRLSIGFTPSTRRQLFQIPTQPWAMSFSKAYYGRPGMPPVLDEKQRQFFPRGPGERISKGSKGWGRVHPNGLLGTIATSCNPTDGRLGTINHWQQPRPLTVLEVRRAQGFRDHELLLGKPATQWRIIGNSVARQVSQALGLAFREAWFGTLFDEPHLPQAGLANVSGTLSQANDIPIPGYISITESIRDSQEVDTESVTTEAESSSSNTPPSEDPFFISSPQKYISLTPATSDSNDVSDYENNRKRPSTTLYVEILAKKPRLGIGHGQEGHDQ